MTDDKQIKLPEPEPCHTVGGDNLSRAMFIMDVLIWLGIVAIAVIVVLKYT